MGIFIEKKKYIAAAVAAVTVCLLMIIYSDIAVLSARKGIVLWSGSVLPAMLPFFICVNFMTGIGLMKYLPANIFPFVMSAMSGYPMGAKIIGEMCRSGIADTVQAKRFISFCSTSGPVFMIGAVGVGMLGSKDAGYVIAASHYAGALMNGAVYTLLLKGDAVKYKGLERIEECSLMKELTEAIFGAFRSMGVILVYIIFFMFLIDLAAGSGITAVFGGGAPECLIKGIIEMTVGCGSIAETGLDVKESCVLAGAIISWGGLSILGQSMSMLGGSGISFGFLALTKFTHAIFTVIISLFLGNLML